MAVVVNPDGSTSEQTVTLHTSPSQTIICDSYGDSLVISKKGQVMGVREYRATGGNRALLNEYHRKTDSAGEWYVNFLPVKEQSYGFDYLKSGDHGIFATSENYPKSGNYDFRFKSIATTKNDKVKVDFGSYPEKDSVIFKDKYGVRLKLSKDNVLNFTAISTADTNYIYAYRGDKKIGKLMVKTYEMKTYKLTLVSVNKAKLPDLSELKKYLDKIYKPANIDFEISAEQLTIDNLFPFSHGDKNRLSGYNDDQKRILEAFDSRIKEDVNYLFFIPDGAECSGVAGYNPFGYNYGFIYHGASNRTIAHELAHGIASLHHPFSDGAVSGKTDNLLDYNDGLALWHFQWDDLQNPPRRIFKWRFEEEEAEAFEDAKVVCVSDDFIYELKSRMKAEGKPFYFYLADGRIINLEGYSPSGFYKRDDKDIPGAVAKIRVNGIDCGIYYQEENGKNMVRYFGYKSPDGVRHKVLPVDDLIVSATDAMKVFPNVGETCGCRKAEQIDLSERYFSFSDNDKYVVYQKKILSQRDYDIDEDSELVKKLVSALPQDNKSNSWEEYYQRLEQEFGERFVDKIKAYKELNASKNIYILECQSDMLSIDQSKWNLLAKKVYEQADLKSGNILITLPWFNCAGVVPSDREQFYMPGLYCGYESRIETSKLENDYNNIVKFSKDGLCQFVKDVFKYTYKKSELYVGRFGFDDNVVFSCQTQSRETFGYDFSRTIVLLRDKSVDMFVDECAKMNKDYEKQASKIVEKINDYRSLKNQSNDQLNFDEVNKYTKLLQEYEDQLNKLRKEYESKADDLRKYYEENSEPEYVEYSPTRNPQLREEYMDNLLGENANLCNAFAFITTDAFNGLREEYNSKMPYSPIELKPSLVFKSKHSFVSHYDYTMEPYDETVFNVIDGAGCALGFAGMDVFADAAGFVYGVARGKWAEATLYGLSIVVVGPEGNVLTKTGRFAKKEMTQLAGKQGIEHADDVVKDAKKVIDKVDNSTTKMANKSYKELKDEYFLNITASNVKDYYVNVVIQSFIQIATAWLVDDKWPIWNDFFRNVILGSKPAPSSKWQKALSGCIQNVSVEDLHNLFSSLEDNVKGTTPKLFAIVGADCFSGIVLDFLTDCLGDVLKDPKCTIRKIDDFFSLLKPKTLDRVKIFKFCDDIDKCKFSKSGELKKLAGTEHGLKAFEMLDEIGMNISTVGPSKMFQIAEITQLLCKNKKDLSDFANILKRCNPHQKLSSGSVMAEMLADMKLVSEMEGSGVKSISDYLTIDNALNRKAAAMLKTSVSDNAYVELKMNMQRVQKDDGFYFKKSKEIYEKLEPCKDAKGNDCFLKTIVEFKDGYLVDVSLDFVNNVDKAELNNYLKMKILNEEEKK